MASAELTSGGAKPQVVVVGAGLGGLAAAIAIALTEHFHVAVLEAASTLGEIGAGIQLSPNCSRLLIRWGCAKFLDGKVVQPEYGRVSRWQDGKILSQRPMNPLLEKKYGAPYWHAHRADLHEALLLRSRELDVRIRTDACVVDADPGLDKRKPHVTLASGEVIGCDFLIGADGIHSKVRDIVCPGFSGPQATGDLAYRFTVPVAELSQHAILAEIGQRPASSVWWGPGKHVVGYMLRGKSLYNVVAIVPDDGSVTGGHRAVATLEQMKKVFESWCPQVCALIDRAQPEGLAKWMLMDLPPLPTWNKGQCALIGDACHPMLPYLAQGSAQAMEDAAVLALCLQNLPNEFEKAADIYTGLRHHRVTRVQQFSRAQRQKNHLDDGPEQEARDAALADPSAAGNPSHSWKWDARDGEEGKEWMQGLYGYDAEEETMKALGRLGLQAKGSIEKI